MLHAQCMLGCPKLVSDLVLLFCSSCKNHSICQSLYVCSTKTNAINTYDTWHTLPRNDGWFTVMWPMKHVLGSDQQRGKLTFTVNSNKACNELVDINRAVTSYQALRRGARRWGPKSQPHPKQSCLQRRRCPPQRHQETPSSAENRRKVPPLSLEVRGHLKRHI